MILNNADDIMLGDAEVDTVYLGDEEIWSRSGAIELDCTRFDASNPKLYDKKGNELSTLSVLQGSLSDIYVSGNGLRLTSAAVSDIPVVFNKTDPWTLTFRFKALNVSISDNVPSSILNSPGFNIAVVFYSQYSPQSLILCVKGPTSFYDTIYRTNGTTHGTGSSWADLLIPFNNFADYEQEVKIVNDGENCEMYCNGIIKGSCTSDLLTNVSSISLASLSYFPNSKTNFITTGLKIEYFANRTQSFKVYRFVFSKYRAYDDTSVSSSYCFSRLCLYDANNNRLDTDSRCIAGECTIAYGDADVSQYYNRDTKMLVSNNSGVFTGNTYYRDNHTEDVFIFVPSTLPALAKYSIITSPEGTSDDYDPVSWTLKTTNDGGLTWTVLDTQTDYNTPTARSTETTKFVV